MNQGCLAYYPLLRPHETCDIQKDTEFQQANLCGTCTTVVPQTRVVIGVLLLRLVVTGVLHKGHSAQRSTQRSMHALWKECPHPGKDLFRSPSWTSFRQIEHSSEQPQ